MLIHEHTSYSLIMFLGTYRCEVQDASYHRVKSIYWGIRVLPAGAISLDYESALAQWESTGSQQNQTMSNLLVQRMALLSMVWFWLLM